MNFTEFLQKASFILICIFILKSNLVAQQPLSPANNQQSKNELKTDLPDVNQRIKLLPEDKQNNTAEGVYGGQPEKQNKIEQNSRQEQSSEEEAAILPYYNNYLETYLLGPEDIISVEVFGQPGYSKAGIVVPPTARISYPLIPGGVFVGGKTTEQIAEDIKKKLDEYIIDPQVTVTLDKVGSARFSVLGKVTAPGIKVMNRRYNVYEAVAEAGGIAKEGDKKRVILMRINPQGGFTQTLIDFDKLMTGKTEIPYLVPGDQIIVPERKWSSTKIFDIIGRASAFRILFGSPF